MILSLRTGSVESIFDSASDESPVTRIYLVSVARSPPSLAWILPSSTPL